MIQVSMIFPPLPEPKDKQEAVALADKWKEEVSTSCKAFACMARNRALYWKELVYVCEWCIRKATIDRKWLPIAEQVFLLAEDASLHGNEFGGDEDLMSILRVAWENDTKTILKRLNIPV